MPHEEYRCFFNDRRSSAQRSIVDGDLVETFLDIVASRAPAIRSTEPEPEAGSGSGSVPGSATTLAEQIVRHLNEELSSIAARKAGGGESSAGAGAGTGAPISVLFGRGSDKVSFTVEQVLARVEEMAALH